MHSRGNLLITFIWSFMCVVLVPDLSCMHWFLDYFPLKKIFFELNKYRKVHKIEILQFRKYLQIEHSGNCHPGQLLFLFLYT